MTPPNEKVTEENFQSYGRKFPQHISSTSKIVNIYKNNNINKNNTCIEILDFLNCTCGTKYKPSFDNKKHIISRLHEGYTLEDFKAVIIDRHLHWATDFTMCRYLRPETLFGNKFGGYIEEAKLAEYAKSNKAIASRAEEEETKRIISERLALFCRHGEGQKVTMREA